MCQNMFHYSLLIWLEYFFKLIWINVDTVNRKKRLLVPGNDKNLILYLYLYYET